jgi:hypothetical protein
MPIMDVLYIIFVHLSATTITTGVDLYLGQSIVTVISPDYAEFAVQAPKDFSVSHIR